MCVCSCSVVFDSLGPHRLQPTRLLWPQDSPEKEYESGLPFLSLADLTDPVLEPRSPALQADSSLSEPPGKLGLPYDPTFQIPGIRPGKIITE